MNINNNNREDDVKKQNIEIDDVDHGYICDEYKDLIDNILMFRLTVGDLHLTEFDNLKLGLTNIVNNYLEKKILMWMIDCLILRNPLEICQIMSIGYIGLQMVINQKQRSNMKKKRLSSLNAVKNYVLDF